eukprot:TRINITY_DN2399_c0_g1_i1.p1 TRINITY_DN2399_c0_g1~~TRINITY_DN2399_c0_g1_i1.p1  ORF type:complete len:517 (-),score=75.24 TRINITY_DN2399_c0_g1_i1:121-1644(-)
MEVDRPAVATSLQAIYPSAAIPAMSSRYEQLAQECHRLYGKPPTFFGRAPGRVNIIGEHTDYSGYGVLPMALAVHDTVFAVVATAEDGLQEDVVELANLDQARFASSQFVGSAQVDPLKHSWMNYVMAGYQGIRQASRLTPTIKEGPSLPFHRYQILVHGTVPIASGLSSSSAMVCATTLSFAHAKAVPASKAELAELSMKCERFIGLESGGMDQAISYLAELGKAKKIDFDPVRAQDVALPSDISFVIGSSLIEANKYATAQSGYNMRVVECRLAAVILGKKLGHDWAHIRRLIDVQTGGKGSPLSLEQLLAAVEEHLHPEAYFLPEIASLLELGIEEVIERYMGTIIVANPNATSVEAGGTPLYLYKRAKHVYSETKRVEDFKLLCDTAGGKEDAASVLGRLGQLMNESHFSCRDYFECSSPELDKLTALCRDAGAVGSRLTGAGWGGWTISLVPTSQLDSFFAQVGRFYDAAVQADPTSKSLDHYLLATSPGSGATILHLSDLP